MFAWSQLIVSSSFSLKNSWTSAWLPCILTALGHVFLEAWRKKWLIHVRRSPRRLIFIFLSPPPNLSRALSMHLKWRHGDCFGLQVKLISVRRVNLLSFQPRWSWNYPHLLHSPYISRSWCFNTMLFIREHFVIFLVEYPDSRVQLFPPPPTPPIPIIYFNNIKFKRIIYQ